MSTYDVFISHKKEQLSWALRLQETLQQYGYTAFVDHATAANLVAEQDWKQQLQEVTTKSPYMILLWSKKIQPGSFVEQEVSWRIDAINENPNRRLIMLPLDESPWLKVLTDFYAGKQAFRGFIDMHKAAAADGLPNTDAPRDGGAEQLDYFTWNGTVRRFIEETFYDASTRIIEVPFVVAAMNRTQANELIAGQNVAVSKPIYRSLLKSAQTAKSFDVNRYGVTPEAWKPFPKLPYWNELSISEILAQCEAKKQFYVKNNSPFLADRPEYKANRIFVPYTLPLLGSDEDRETALTRLAERPCLVFVDPISLMHSKVKYLYGLVSNKAKKAFTIGMSPLLPVMHQAFTAYLSNEANFVNELGLMSLYDDFYKFFNDALRASIMNVDHGYELARWIQFATDNIVRYNTGLDKGWETQGTLREGPPEVPFVGGRRT